MALSGLDTRKRDRRQELAALALTIALLVGVPALGLGFQAARSSLPQTRTIDVIARLPSEGGFTPDLIHLNRGERTRLRLTSPDVVHGFEIPGLDIRVPDIYPGRVVEVTFVPQEAGRYAFACTRWCSEGHWRMRGVIEVVDPDAPDAPSLVPRSEPPLYQQLGLDLDAVHHASPPVAESLHRLSGLPSASRGAAAQDALPPELRQQSWLRANPPAAAFLLLRENQALSALSDGQVWDLVAYAWQMDVTDRMLARGSALYTRDCAACHGETGRGDGPMGRALPGMQAMMPTAESGPTDWTDLVHVLAISDARLQGKLLRGGMGTGMPEFGSLYPADDQWALVAFIRTFALTR